MWKSYIISNNYNIYAERRDRIKVVTLLTNNVEIDMRKIQFMSVCIEYLRNIDRYIEWYAPRTSLREIDMFISI